MYIWVNGVDFKFRVHRLSPPTSLIVAQEAVDLKILIFDSLTEDLHKKPDLYVGARRNKYIVVNSDVFLYEVMFSWMEPEHIRI